MDAQLEKTQKELFKQLTPQYAFQEFKVYIDRTLKEFGGTNEKAREALKVVKEAISGFEKKIEGKAEREEVGKIEEKMKELCKYKDLKDLYNKKLPAIRRFENTLVDYSSEVD